MNDRAPIAPPPERSVANQDVVGRWQGAFKLYNQGSDGQTNIRGITRIFLKSVFSPQSIPQADRFPQKVDRALVEKLSGFGPLGSVKPSEAILKEAEKIMIHKIIDVEPPTVPGAKETIQELAKKTNFTIWTVGDTVESTHNLPEELVGTRDKLRGTGHQLWKLWKLGLTDKPNINVDVSDNKIERVVNNIAQQKKQGIHRFVFMDDDINNLQKLQQIIDQENMQRELVGETPITYDLVHVNQGTKRQTPAARLATAGSLGTFSTIDAFPQAVQKTDELQQVNGGDRLGVFCDFDGVVTDNVAMRAEWDKIAQETADDVVKKSSLKNPQKEIAPAKISPEDIRLAKIKQYIEDCKAKGLRVGVMNGAFDLPHSGHLQAIVEARNACDILVVMINSDESIRKNKGIKAGVPRPVESETERAVKLLANENVAGVVVFEENNPSTIIKQIRPNVYVSSDEYKDKDLEEFKAVKETGADIVFTSPRSGKSTSSTIESILKGFLITTSNNGTGDAARVLLDKLAQLSS